MDNQNLEKEIELKDALEVIRNLGITTSIFVSNFKMLLDTKNYFENNMDDEELAEELIQDIKNMELMLNSVEGNLEKAKGLLN